MNHFIEASHVGLDANQLNSSEHGQVYLTYMFGAVDALCQVHQIDTASTVSLFQELLEDIMGGYSPDEAKQLVHDILRTSETAEGQRIMSEGGESVQTWISGAKLAPHRLQELLLEIEE